MFSELLMPLPKEAMLQRPRFLPISQMRTLGLRAGKAHSWSAPSTRTLVSLTPSAAQGVEGSACQRPLAAGLQTRSQATCPSLGFLSYETRSR